MTDTDRDRGEIDTAAGNHDLTEAEIERIGQGGPVYRDESGEYWGFLSVALRGVKQGYEIVEVENGFLVEEELFERVTDGPNTLNSDDSHNGNDGDVA